MSKPPELWNVGELVRVRRSSKFACLATIVTIQNDDGTVEVLFEVDAPQTLTKVLKIAPVFINDTEGEIEQEAVVFRDQVMKLLPFEPVSFEREDAHKVTTKEWKSKGDELLRIGDANAAIPCYEKALSAIDQSVHVGSTVLIKEKTGHIRVADVDCYNDDDHTIDTTLYENQEEKVFPLSLVILVVSTSDSERLQERILLNLGRCMLLMCNEFIPASRHSTYYKHAVLAFSLSLSVAKYLDRGKIEVSSTVVNSLLLRAKAQVGLSKFTHAKADIKVLLKIDTSHKEANKLMKEIENIETMRRKTDRKLAKEMCQWVQGTALKDAVSKENKSTVSRQTQEKQQINCYIYLLQIVLIIVLAYFIQSFTNNTNDR